MFLSCLNFKKDVGMDVGMDMGMGKKKPESNHVLRREVISKAQGWLPQIFPLPRDPVLTAEYATPISLTAKRHFTKS